MCNLNVFFAYCATMPTHTRQRADRNDFMTFPPNPPPRVRFLSAVRLPDSGDVLVVEAGPETDEILAAIGGLRAITCHGGLLTEGLLNRVRPDIVLAPLLGRRQDIVEIAQLLGGMGYDGVLCGVCTPPIDPRLVASEVAAACPRVRFCMIAVSD